MNKHFLYLTIITLFIITGCASYNKTKLFPSEVFHHEKIPDVIDLYQVYVHDNNQLYKSSAPKITRDTLFSQVKKVAVDSLPVLDRLKSKKEREKRNEIHIYTNRPINISKDSSKTSIAMQDIERIEMYEKNEKSVFAKVGLILGIVLGAGLIIFGFFVLLVYALGAAFVAASNGSNSGGSNSSGSNSGGSNSSGSNSGGCYVATMVYGSYDAEEVLVLRRFRDNFLQNFHLGRQFISWYYAKSPSFVEKHKNKKRLHRIIKFILDRFVNFLR